MTSKPGAAIAAARWILLGFGLMGSVTASAQGINQCLDVAGGYMSHFSAALDLADANHCERYAKAISWETKAIQQLRSCLTGAQPGRQAEKVTLAIGAAERATASAREAALKDGCKANPEPSTEPGRADCTETERVRIEQRLIGTWGVRLASGANSCITLRYEEGGKFVQSASSHCSGGGTAGSTTKSWTINDNCQLVQTGVGEPQTPHNLEFLDGDRQVRVFDSENLPFTLYRDAPATSAPSRAGQRVQRTGSNGCLGHCLAVMRGLGAGPGSAGWNECYRQVARGTSFCKGR